MFLTTLDEILSAHAAAACSAGIVVVRTAGGLYDVYDATRRIVARGVDWARLVAALDALGLRRGGWRAVVAGEWLPIQAATVWEAVG
jgi:hypothetical protein